MTSPLINGEQGYQFALSERGKARFVALRLLGMSTDWALFWAFVVRKGDGMWDPVPCRNAWISGEKELYGFSEPCCLVPDEVRAYATYHDAA